MNSTGNSYLSALLQHGTIHDMVNLGIKEDFFNATERPAFEFITNFVKSYGKIPDQTTVTQHMAASGFMLSPVMVTEPVAYYADALKNRWMTDSAKNEMMAATLALNNNTSTPTEALEALSQKIFEMRLATSPDDMVDFRYAGERILEAYHDAMHGGALSSLKYGWPTLDDMSGGAKGGDLLSIVGRPAAGKTFLGLWMAMNMWAKHKKSVMFVSMEMLPVILCQRIATMYAHTPLGQLLRGKMTTKIFNTFKAGLGNAANEEAPFWIIDGNLTATVEQVWMQMHMLKPDFVFIDGAYLMSHPNTRLGRFERVAENTRLMKNELCTGLKTPVGASWQFNRSAAKKAKDSKTDEVGDLEDIGFSDEIGQLSSMVLGLFQHDGIDTLDARKVSVLKGRSGELGDFDINWNFWSMDFSERKQVALDAVQFQ